MRAILKPLLEATIKSPVLPLMIAWSVLMTLGMLALALAAPMILWDERARIFGGEVSPGDVGSLLFLFVFFGLGAVMMYQLVKLSWGATLNIARSVRDDLKEATEEAREVLDERAERAAKLEAQGGQLSLSELNGEGGELTEIRGAAGLEVVEGDHEGSA